MRESQLGDYGSGLAPSTEGWFVVNVRDAEWWSSETRGARCSFESEYGEPPVEFAQVGINVTVLEPGQTILYHAEANQESGLRELERSGIRLVRYRIARRATRREHHSRSVALTGTIGARRAPRAWTASMISALSMPWR
jgi:hypothetical protein